MKHGSQTEATLKAGAQGSAAERGARGDTGAPPGEVPGYQLLRRLGSGAYGEVWVAVDNNTGRRVAIKFFAHRARLDPSLLSREIEKLVFLSADRYVVQLLDVGWAADPPYFVMEYVEYGSLEDRLRREGTLSVPGAVELFREIAIGLSHAHGKGVLHCDLKPANILLDQDLRPRLADFGQSRLSHEQRPALGTLFYMAPEQADLRAIPDARWDIYGLGAIIYCALVGHPPHRNDESVSDIETAPNLEERLHRYRRYLKDASPPTEHRRLAPMDRALAEIIDRCLAAHPDDRYPHAVSLLNDLEQRDRQRVRRPFLVLGLLGPLLLLLTMGFFGYRAYHQAVAESRDLVTRGALETNRFAAEGEARNVANELEKRFQAVASWARHERTIEQLQSLLDDPDAHDALAILCQPRSTGDPQWLAWKTRLLSLGRRRELEAFLQTLLDDPLQPAAASWFITDARGTMLAGVFRDPEGSVVGNNYAWRAYFHGGPEDLPKDARPAYPLQQPRLSPVFQSTATDTWKFAISAPIRSGDETIGLLAITEELGEIVRFPSSTDQCAMLVDGRPGRYQGVVLDHPLLDQILTEEAAIPTRFSRYRVNLDAIHERPTDTHVDPLAADSTGGAYRGEWIVGVASVCMDLPGHDRSERRDTGWVMLVQSRAAAANRAIESLAQRLYREGVSALLGFFTVMVAMWLLVVQFARRTSPKHTATSPSLTSSPASVHSRDTLVQFP